MSKFSRLFGKKDKETEAKDAGDVFIAAEVPFRPHQCTTCDNYRKEIKRCEAFSQSTSVGKMYAMFSGESREDCPRYEPATEIDVEKLKEIKDVQGLIKALHKKDYNISSKASVALKEIGESAVEPLISELKRDKDSDFRYKVAIILGNIGDSRAVEPLLNSIKTDPVRDVRWHAVDSLGKIGDAGAAAALEQLLTDTDSYVRSAAKEALEKIRAQKY
jgi:HEAT repeat protein